MLTGSSELLVFGILRSFGGDLTLLDFLVLHFSFFNKNRKKIIGTECAKFRHFLQTDI